MPKQETVPGRPRGASPADPEGQERAQLARTNPGPGMSEHDRVVTQNPESPGRDPNAETGDITNRSVPHSDYPEMGRPATANPAAQERGANAVDPSNAVGSPEAVEERQPGRSTPSELDLKNLTREQWQSLPEKKRLEWKTPEAPHAMTLEQQQTATGIHPGLALGDLWKYSEILMKLIQVFEGLQNAKPGDNGETPVIRTHLHGQPFRWGPAPWHVGPDQTP